jgi:hypothetical protein
MVFGNSLLPEINSPIVGGKPSHRSRQDLEKAYTKWEGFR